MVLGGSGVWNKVPGSIATSSWIPGIEGEGHYDRPNRDDEWEAGVWRIDPLRIYALRPAPVAQLERHHVD